jgi:FAD/FMN-containing dehydrogenase
MKIKNYHSWGNYPNPGKLIQKVRTINSRNSIDLKVSENETLLPYGNGRSYGDSCLNDGGTLLHMKDLNQIIEFDSENGIIKCEAGVLISEVIDLISPHKWFLMVTPGTRFITIGGAVANDIHGKNHHQKGTFGCHVIGFELMRSDGQILFCSRDKNEKLFSATIGGLGLTGVITWIKFSLLKVNSLFMDVETLSFNNLDEFFKISKDSDKSYDYSVAWIDCLASGSKIGRGVFKRARHSPEGGLVLLNARVMTLRITPPFSLVNQFSLKLFNSFYRWISQKNEGYESKDILSFFYPLDSIKNWNRLYGKKGFLQYQCVIPMDNAKSIIREILERISNSKQGSFLAVLKVFGNIESPGMLSFPRQGVTLALDFPNKGDRLFKLLNELDQLVISSGGAIYPAKDARMSKEVFCASYPEFNEFSIYIDPVFSSSFLRRVGEERA